MQRGVDSMRLRERTADHAALFWQGKRCPKAVISTHDLMPPEVITSLRLIPPARAGQRSAAWGRSSNLYICSTEWPRRPIACFRSPDRPIIGSPDDLLSRSPDDPMDQ
jgi:hypothetical protein